MVIVIFNGQSHITRPGLPWQQPSHNDGLMWMKVLNTLTWHPLGLNLDVYVAPNNPPPALGFPCACLMIASTVEPRSTASMGTHRLSCCRSQGCHSCHASVNALIHRHLSSAGILAQLQPMGVCRTDGKHGPFITP